MAKCNFFVYKKHFESKTESDVELKMFLVLLFINFLCSL